MDQHVQVVYECGVLRPLTPLDLPERAQFSITLHETSAATSSEPFDLKNQQQALDEMFRKIQKLPQTPSGDGLSNRDHDQILYGSPK